jgi:hypothetical protein
MRRILGALSSLAVLVTLWGAFADDPRDVEFDRPAAAPPVQLTPEQREVVTEALDELGRNLLQAIRPFVKANEDQAAENGLILDEVNGILGVVHEFDLDEFQTMLRPELLFLRKVCELSESEFQTIRESCLASLPEANRQFAAEQEQRLRDERHGKSPSAEAKPAIQRVRESVLQVAECQLTAEQWERYSIELQLRSAYRKRVAIHCLVARLDHDLRLTPTQREQFVTLLQKNWKESWSQSLGAYSDESNYMPELAQDEVRSILSPVQVAVLSELSYEADPDVWDDGSVDLFFEMEDEAMEDDMVSADSKPTQTPNASDTDQ